MEKSFNISMHIYCLKNVQVQSFSGPYFSIFGLNKEIYGVNLQKIGTRKNVVFGHFSRSDICHHFQPKTIQ